MNGGTVINIVKRPKYIWVQCLDTNRETGAIAVKDSKEMKTGDHIYWDEDVVLWTPVDSKQDIELEIVGKPYYGIPDEIMETTL